MGTKLCRSAPSVDQSFFVRSSVSSDQAAEVNSHAKPVHVSHLLMLSHQMIRLPRSMLLRLIDGLRYDDSILSAEISQRPVFCRDALGAEVCQRCMT